MIGQIVEKVQNFFGSKSVRKEPRIISADENKIDRMQISPLAMKVCRKLQKAGGEAFIVGGAVRDLLIGHKPKDFDVATNETPESVKKIMGHAIIIGRRFRLVHVNSKRETVEVATFRGLDDNGVKKDVNGMVLNDNVFGEQYEDAARRDFTINALYYDPVSGDVYDYHDGLKDIRKKRIRMIGNPVVRYQEDPVRILRAIRIASKLGFKIDPKTAAPMREMSINLQRIPLARLADEIQKILNSGASAECFDLMAQYGVDVPEGQFELLMPRRTVPLLRLAFASSDSRIQQGKHINATFLVAAAYWDIWKEFYGKAPGETAQQKAVAAFLKLKDDYFSKVPAVGQNYVDKEDVFRIFRAQVQMELMQPRYVHEVAGAKVFRAAQDFLALRAELGEVSPEVAEWWAKFRELRMEGRVSEASAMVQALREKMKGSSRGTGRSAGTRRRSPRRRNTERALERSSQDKELRPQIPAPETEAAGTPLIQVETKANQESAPAPQAAQERAADSAAAETKPARRTTRRVTKKTAETAAVDASEAVPAHEPQTEVPAEKVPAVKTAKRASRAKTEKAVKAPKTEIDTADRPAETGPSTAVPAEKEAPAKRTRRTTRMSKAEKEQAAESTPAESQNVPVQTPSAEKTSEQAAPKRRSVRKPPEGSYEIKPPVTTGGPEDKPARRRRTTRAAQAHQTETATEPSKAPAADAGAAPVRRRKTAQKSVLLTKKS